MPRRLGAEPGRGAGAVAVADDDVRLAVRRDGIEWQSSSSASPWRSRSAVQPVGQRLVIGPVDLLDAPVELGAVDRPPPQRAMAMGARRDQAQPVARARADRGRARSRRSRRDRPHPRRDCSRSPPAAHAGPPRRSRRRSPASTSRSTSGSSSVSSDAPALCGIGQHLRVIIASRMRDRQQHRQGTARADEWSGEDSGPCATGDEPKRAKCGQQST